MKRKSCITLAIVLSLILIAGCAWTCKNVTQENLDKLSQALHALQSGYDTSVTLAAGNIEGISSTDAATLAAISSAAKVALPFIDAALQLLGQAIQTKCEEDAALALTTAQAAQKAQDQVLEQAKAKGIRVR